MQSSAGAGHGIDLASTTEVGGLQRRSPHRPQFPENSSNESPLRLSGDGLAQRRSPNRTDSTVNTAAPFQNLSSAQTSPSRGFSNKAEKHQWTGSPLRHHQNGTDISSSMSRAPQWFQQLWCCSKRASKRPHMVGDKYMSSVMTWVESALLLSGGACILLFVFLAVVEVDLSFGEDALERELGALDPRGSGVVRNVSAYHHDAFVMHWAGKACEKTPIAPSDVPHGTSAGGVLPSVVVIGVHKGGSSALFSYLAAHGDVRPSYCKEAHFFDWKYNAIKRQQAQAVTAQNSNQDIQLFRQLYATFFRSRDPGMPPFKSIEGTPEYFFSQEIPRRMHAILPDTNIVVALRNPVERSISHFMGKAKTDFKSFPSCTAWFNRYAALTAKCDALRPSAHGQRVQPGVWPLPAEMIAAWNTYATCIMDGDNPVAKSIYAPQLLTWLQFYSPSKLHVVQSDRLFAFPQEEVRRLTDAFGWRPHFPHESDTFGVVGSDHMRKFNARLLQPNVGRQQASFNRLFDCDVGAMQRFFYTYEQDLWDVLAAVYPQQLPYFTKWSLLDTTGPQKSAALLRRP